MNSFIFPNHFCIWILFLVLLLPLPASGQPTKYEDILAFVEPWVWPQDYAWSRESTSRLQSDQEPGLRIKDVGRLRVEFVKFADESANLNIRVLQYQFETQIREEKPAMGVSDLQGQLLPPLFLHWAMGFSLGIEPGVDLPKPVSGQQASQVFDLMDFRGVIPDKPLRPGEEWQLKVVPDRGKAFLFKEELERSFRCESTKTEGAKTQYAIHFKELFKITPTKESGNWELTEREGTYWVSLPKKMIEAAEWKTHSTESMKGPMGSSKVMTETSVSLSHVEVSSNGNTRKPKAEKPETSAGSGEKQLPLPPR